MKLRFFYKLDRDYSRPLVLWGAGRNGKDMAKLILSYDDKFHWVCDNANKIGRDIYGVNLQHFGDVLKINNPQIIIVVASPASKVEITKQLEIWHKKRVKDFWFFA